MRDISHSPASSLSGAGQFSLQAQADFQIGQLPLRSKVQQEPAIPGKYRNEKLKRALVASHRFKTGIVEIQGTLRQRDDPALDSNWGIPAGRIGRRRAAHFQPRFA